MRLFFQHIETLSKPLERDLSKVWAALGKEAAEAYVGIPKSKEANPVDAAAIAAAAEHDVIRVIRRMDLAKVEDNVGALVQRQHLRVIDSTVGTINAVFDLGVNLPDHVARAIVAEGGKRAGLVDIEEGTKKAIFRSLLDGRILGEGQDQLARRIRHEVPAGRFVNAGPAYRSKLIARTETKWAQNISAKAAYVEAGATHAIAFDAQGSGPSDPGCEARNGQTFAIDDIDAELADEHPNGTLSFAPVFSN